MDQIKNHIKELLKQDLILKPELNEFLFSNLERLSPEKLTKLVEVLTRTLSIQHKLLVDLVKKNPNLKNEIKQVFKKSNREERVSREAHSCKEDQNVLSGLEEELNNLFQ